MKIALLKQKRLTLAGFIFIFIFSFTPVFAQVKDNLRDVKTKIHILNLLNGLELDKKQMQLILDAAQKAENIRIKFKKEILQKEEEIASIYNEVLRIAKSGSLVIPDDIALRVHKVNQELDKIKQRAQEKLTLLSIKIKDNLEPHQLYVLDDYKPCIIPKVKQGRIGQADDPKGFVKVLERVHSMPQKIYNLKKDQISQNTIDRVKTKVPPGFIIDQEELKTQLLKTVDEVRQMSDVDFTLKKEEIGKDIKVNLLPERSPLNIGVKIERFLLSPEIIPLLEERIIS